MSIEQRKAVYLIADYDGKIPMLYRCNTGFMDNHWGMIAGRVEINESVRDAVIREAKEEVGLKLKVGDLDLVHVCNRLQTYNNIVTKNWTDFYFYTKNLKQLPTNKEPDKHSELKMFTINKLPKNTVPYIKFALKSYFTNKKYSEYGFKK